MKNLNWAVVIGWALATLFAVLYFRTCNVPIVSNTRVEDSLRHVAKVKDSIYNIKSDSGHKVLDSLGKHDSVVTAKYDGLKPKLNAANSKVAALEEEVSRLRGSSNIDSLTQALSDVNSAYLEAMDLLHTMASASDSALTVRKAELDAAKSLLDQAESEIKDLRNQRDAALADDHSKDSIINKQARKIKANNIWAKIATISTAILAAITIIKK